ncbi:MAG: TPM domain-containing protein [Ruminococcaceae bacterium]|nr:TPM domain-containing protein [Oscillospiraceae bacterium]
MKNKFLISFVCALLFISFSFTVSAEYSHQRLLDDADILTEFEEKTLSESLDEYSNKLGFEIMILTTDKLGFSKPTDTTSYSSEYIDEMALSYAERYYQSCGFTYDVDGVVFVRYINDYDVYMRMVSFGELTKVFDDSACDKVLDSVETYIVRGSTNVAFGFEKYLEKVENVYLTRNDLTFKAIVTCLILALVLSLVVVMIMKSKLKSVKFQTYANNYLKLGSFNLTDSKDIYLYRNVTRVRMQSNSSSGGRSRGGGGGGGRRS